MNVVIAIAWSALLLTLLLVPERVVRAEVDETPFGPAAPGWAHAVHVIGARPEVPLVEEEISVLLKQQFVVDVAPPQDVPALIVEAARRWGLDEGTLLRVAWCESRWNPQAVSAAGHLGIFQFAPHTWAWASDVLGFPHVSPFDPAANIEAAAWLYATQGPQHWGCK